MTQRMQMMNTSLRNYFDLMRIFDRAIFPSRLISVRNSHGDLMASRDD